MTKQHRFRFVWLLAKRDIFEDKLISFIVVGMLAFSFLNLAFFPAFVNGLNEAFIGNIVETQTGHIFIQAEDGRLTNADALATKIGSLDEVASVEKRLQLTARITYADEQVAAPLIGTSTPGAAAYHDRIVDGRFLRYTENDLIVLGRFIAQDDETSGDTGLGADIGRNVQIHVDGRTQTMNVAGVIGRPGPGAVASQAFITYEAAEALLEVEDEATAIKVLLHDRSQADAFREKLQALNTRGRIQTWREVSDITEGIDRTFSIVVAIISLVGIVVAVTSIGVVIFINTNKRRQEMGIIRSIGVERREVILIFLTEAFLFGVIGVIIGNLFMIGIDHVLTANPIQTPIGPLQTIVPQSLLIERSLWMLAAAVVAGILPAYLVSKREIVDTITGQ